MRKARFPTRPLLVAVGVSASVRAFLCRNFYLCEVSKERLGDYGLALGAISSVEVTVPRCKKAHCTDISGFRFYHQYGFSAIV